MSRILIIEDEPAMRTVLTDLLVSEGHRVIAASQGADGLERALAEQPDLILLDVMMPRLDGFALAQELRRLGRAVPILMLTAKGRVEDRVRGLDSGADDYLVKPFSGDELLARVRALLRRQHALSQPQLAQRTHLAEALQCGFAGVAGFVGVLRRGDVALRQARIVMSGADQAVEIGFDRRRNAERGHGAIIAPQKLLGRRRTR